MVRKHTGAPRRLRTRSRSASRFSIGLMAAGAGAATHCGKPTVTIGTKNFTEQYVLGQLYKQALEAKGYKVVYKENIGSSELIDTALKSGKINFYPEYTGVIVTDLAKKPFAEDRGRDGRSGEEVGGGARVTRVLTRRRSTTRLFVVLTATAKKLGVKTIADMKKVKSFSYAGFPECKTRITCLLGLKKHLRPEAGQVRAAREYQRRTRCWTRAISPAVTSSRRIRSSQDEKYTVLEDRSTSSGSRTSCRSSDEVARRRRDPHEDRQRRLGEADDAGDDRDEQGRRASTRSRRATVAEAFLKANHLT